MIIDFDSHIREEYFLDEVYKLTGEYAKYTPVRIGGQYQEARFEVPFGHGPGNARAREAFGHRFFYDPKVKWRGGEIAERQVGGYDMDRRLRDNAKEGIEGQIVFPTRAIAAAATEPGGLGTALCRAYNNWVAKLVKGREDKLWPVAVVPAGAPEAMAAELRRCVSELGFKAGHLVPYAGHRNLDDPAFHSYYQAAQELDVPLLEHPPSLGDLADRFDNFFPIHVIGRPANCTAALVALVTGGVFEKFPKLRVTFFECGAEWILYWMDRMDDDYEWTKDDQAKHLAAKPSEYVKRNCYVTCEVDEKRLPLAIEELGEDHILMATDYPHFDSMFPKTVSTIREREDLTKRQKEKILGANAAQLLKL